MVPPRQKKQPEVEWEEEYEEDYDEEYDDEDLTEEDW